MPSGAATFYTGCNSSWCCVLTLYGTILQACPTEELGRGLVAALPPTEVASFTSTTVSQAVGHTAGRLKVLNLNAGMYREFPGGSVGQKERRVAALAEHLRTADYDVVILQELFYNEDFNLLQVRFLRCPKLKFLIKCTRLIQL